MLRDPVEIYKSALDYVDAHGYICPKKTKPEEHCANGNGNLDTAIFFLLLRGRTGNPLFKHLRDNFDRALEDSKLEKGVYLRGPHKKNDQVSRDDYIGLLSYFKYFNLLKSIEILVHGRKTFYCYNTDDKTGIKDTFARFLGFVSHVHYCCFVKPLLIFRMMSYISLSFFHKMDGTDGITLDWLQYLSTPRKSSLERRACLNFLKYLKKRGGMRNIFEQRYGRDHVITKITPKWGVGRI